LVSVGPAANLLQSRVIGKS